MTIAGPPGIQPIQCCSSLWSPSRPRSDRVDVEATA